MVNILNEETGTGTGPENPAQFDSLFNAPDLATFVKLPATATSREYEQRLKALLKAGVIGSLNAGNLADAAALLWHGPGFAAAGGQLAEADERAKKAIDLLTTPSNPYGMFLITVIPLVAQLARNHENQIKQAPENFRNRKERRAQAKAQRATQPAVNVKLPFGKAIKLRFAMKFPVGKMFAGFKGQTQDPNAIAFRVFSDPKVVTALQKQGVQFQTANGNQDG